MRSMRVALYDIKSGTFNEIRDKVAAEMVPLFQHSDGFVSYGVAEITNNAFMSLSTWETRAEANAANTEAADWVRTSIDDLFTLRESYVGDLAIDAGKPTPPSIAR